MFGTIQVLAEHGHKDFKSSYPKAKRKDPTRSQTGSSWFGWHEPLGRVMPPFA